MSFLQYADKDIQVNGLKDDLIRFRLQGPLSHPVLLDALQVAEVISTATESADQTWWEKFYAVSTLLIEGRGHGRGELGVFSIRSPLLQTGNSI